MKRGCRLRARPGSGRNVACAIVLGLPGLVMPIGASAQQPTVLAPVVVTPTRSEARGFDLPVSVDAVGADEIQQGQLQVNLSESLGRVPGVVVQNRQNYAQDLQISSRGFGARSTFGVRGLRLFSDGIPATMPDGQGQVSHFALGSAKRVEVLRGPFSVLYGNASGGVIQVFTEDGAREPFLEPSAAFGSFGTSRLGLKASGRSGPLDYVAEGSRFETDGYRDHSAARRDSANAKLGVRIGNATTLSLIANHVDMPEAQDPLGLSRDQFLANPRQVDPVAIAFNTRKSVTQTQGGLVLEHALSDAHGLRLMAYTGARDVRQFLAIPTGPQAAPTHAGGVIDLEREYRGLDARWTYKSRLLDGLFRLAAGLNYDTLDERRRGFQNFVGTQLGVQGALRRDEDNRVTSFDQYAQAEWQFARDWLGTAGVRRSSVRFRSKDNYIVGANPDDSGSVRFSATTPVAGLVYSLDRNVNLYASVGRGFETPTFNELAYRPSGLTGLNFDLKPSRSTNYEVGAKMLLGASTEASVAAFHIITSDELVVQTNAGGRSTFQNAGRTRRDGLEAGLATRLTRNLSLLGSVSAIRAVYDDDFLTCAAAPCTAPTVRVPSGNYLPGVPRLTGYAELAWRQPGLTTALELRAVDRIFVNDLNTETAPGYLVANWRLVLEQKLGRWTFSEFLRVDNLLDRKYSGSVIVNDGNGRFYEPAPGRAYLVGVSVQYRFQ